MRYDGRAFPMAAGELEIRLRKKNRTIESALERLRDGLNRCPEYGLALEIHSATETTKLLGKPPRKSDR